MAGSLQDRINTPRCTNETITEAEFKGAPRVPILSGNHGLGVTEIRCIVAVHLSASDGDRLKQPLTCGEDNAAHE